jgi:hypothetical protein
MTIVELLSDLRVRDVNLWLDGENLRLEAPPAALTDSLRQELARHKGEIVEFLRPAGVLAPHSKSEVWNAFPRLGPAVPAHAK